MNILLVREYFRVKIERERESESERERVVVYFGEKGWFIRELNLTYCVDV